MVYSSDTLASHRGFVPPQNDQEKLIMRRAVDLLRVAQGRWEARYSGFLSDREQDLCSAALNREGCDWYRFWGGYPDAERQLLCLEPVEEQADSPVVCIQIESSQQQALAHKDYLGALMGLSIQRTGVGDILLDPSVPGLAYVFVLPTVAELIMQELTSVGNTSVRVCMCDAKKAASLAQLPRVTKHATVSSLRADAVLAAMLNCSRTIASDLIRAGKVEIGHIPVHAAHAPVYQGDTFTVRGKGRFKLQNLGGKSRKDRLFIEYTVY